MKNSKNNKNKNDNEKINESIEPNKKEKKNNIDNLEQNKNAKLNSEDNSDNKKSNKKNILDYFNKYVVSIIAFYIFSFITLGLLITLIVLVAQTKINLVNNKLEVTLTAACILIGFIIVGYFAQKYYDMTLNEVNYYHKDEPENQKAEKLLSELKFTRSLSLRNIFRISFYKKQIKSLDIPNDEQE